MKEKNLNNLFQLSNLIMKISIEVLFSQYFIIKFARKNYTKKLKNNILYLLKTDRKQETIHLNQDF